MERKNYNAHHFTSAGDPGKYGKHRKNLCCYGNRSAFDRLTEKEIKRAGMDYWEHLNVTRYMNFEEFQSLHPGVRIWMATTKAKHVYSDVSFDPDDYIMFGKESAGIPEEILVAHEETCIRIPMEPAIRSLNLSNSVAIVLYEALRQQRFASMQLTGELHRLSWKTEE